MWALNPFPQAPTKDFPSPCKTHAKPVAAPMAIRPGEPEANWYGHNPSGCSGNWPTTVMIMDQVRVPADLPPGEYVLGWRW